MSGKSLMVIEQPLPEAFRPNTTLPVNKIDWQKNNMFVVIAMGIGGFLSAVWTGGLSRNLEWSDSVVFELFNLQDTICVDHNGKQSFNPTPKFAQEKRAQEAHWPALEQFAATITGWDNTIEGAVLQANPWLAQVIGGFIDSIGLPDDPDEMPDYVEPSFEDVDWDGDKRWLMEVETADSSGKSINPAALVVLGLGLYNVAVARARGKSSVEGTLHKLNENLRGAIEGAFKNVGDPKVDRHTFRLLYVIKDVINKQHLHAGEWLKDLVKNMIPHVPNPDNRR